MNAPLPELRQQARNRWPGVLAHMGIETRLLDGKQRPCPLCGGKDRFRFDNLEGNGTWICNRCGAGDGARLLELKLGWSFRDVASAVREVVGVIPETRPGKKADPAQANALCRELWGRSVPVAGTMAEAYLLSRGFEPPFPPVLRFCADAAITGHSELSVMPALVAIVTGPDGKAATLHRTYLQDGCKAPIDRPRRVMPGHIPDGSAIRLAPVGPALGIGEGIETANAGSLRFGIPAWAAISATMLEKFEPPPAVRVLHVFGDHDAKFGGQAAAYRLAHRVACRDGAPDVRVHIPETVGADWADIQARPS